MSKLRLLLIQGGPSSEHDVSLSSGRMVADALGKDKYDVRVVTVGRDGGWIPPKKGEYDVAFIAMHGAFGEDGTVQRILEEVGLPYTGSGPEASALAMDKLAALECFRRAGLKVPASGDGSWPVIIKPCHGGSSVGVSIAYTPVEAQRGVEAIEAAGDTAIVQEQLVGREFTCGILDDERGEPGALPPTEIIPMKGGMFDYDAKYTPGASREITPPELPDSQISEIQQAALAAHNALGCSGMSRSDFILKGGKFYILETNTIPGMTATSLLPQEAKAAGLEFSAMLDRIIKSAIMKNR